jgi:hypothetical protein
MTSTLDLITTRELAALLKRAPETLIRWRRLRIGPPFKTVHGRILYGRREVEGWLAQSSIAEPQASKQPSELEKPKLEVVK